MSITVQFFLDFSFIQSLDDKQVDIAKGHLILFSQHDKDETLKVASLLDGTSIDFLFGVSRTNQNSENRARSNNAKRFIAALDSNHQLEVAKFYSKVYQSIVDYYDWRANSWCWCFDGQRHTMLRIIESEFLVLKIRLGTVL